MTSSSNSFDETTVSLVVDRILKSINVNEFITSDKGNSSQSAPQIKTQPSTHLTSTSQPPANSDDQSPASNTTSKPPATSIIAEFVAAANTTLLTAQLRSRLRECILDFIAVGASGATIAPSSEPILKGLLVFAGELQTSSAQCTVIAKKQTQAVHYAALLNATYAHSLDFDDTHAESSLHAGVSSIATALAEAEKLARSGVNDITIDNILLAILLGYEVTIRLGVALSTAAYSRGFHNTSTAGIFGSVAVIASLRRLSADTIMHAFGIAGSKAAGSMQYLANGSHNKRLHPGFAAHDAFLCVSLAEAGVIGADKIIEGDLGLCQAYTSRSSSDIDWQRLISGLGTRWEFTDNALKPYAGCRMTHAFIQLADSVGQRFRDGAFEKQGAKSIARIRCHMPKANMILIGQRLPNKIHPKNIVDAQFSCYFQVANAILYGGTHDLAAYDRLKDPEILKMCDKIECVVSDAITKMGGQMDVWFEDENGEIAEIVRRNLPEPLGEQSNPFLPEAVHAKFMGLTSPVYGVEHATKILHKVNGLKDNDQADTLLELLALIGSTQPV